MGLIRSDGVGETDGFYECKWMGGWVDGWMDGRLLRLECGDVRLALCLCKSALYLYIPIPTPIPTPPRSITHPALTTTTTSPLTNPTLSHHAPLSQ